MGRTANGIEVDRLEQEALIAFAYRNYQHKVGYMVYDSHYLRRLFNGLIEL